MSRLHRINRIHNNLQLLLSFNGQRKIKRAFGAVDGIQNKNSQEVAVKQLYQNSLLILAPITNVLIGTEHVVLHSY